MPYRPAPSALEHCHVARSWFILVRDMSPPAPSFLKFQLNPCGPWRSAACKLSHCDQGGTQGGNLHLSHLSPVGRPHCLQTGLDRVSLRALEVGAAARRLPLVPAGPWLGDVPAG